MPTDSSTATTLPSPSVVGSGHGCGVKIPMLSIDATIVTEKLRSGPGVSSSSPSSTV